MAVARPSEFTIRIAEPVLGNTERKYLLAALDAGEVSSQGRFVRQFEERFAGYIGVRHGISTSSGTTALHLALVALEVQPGDEVIVPALTFVATANAVAYCGGRPQFVDVHPRYWGIVPEGIERKITPRTKGIIVVHLYGHPVDMDPILEIARRRGLWVLEDAAEAHGAEYKGRRVGSLAAGAVFSFYANKIITTGEGGIFLTNDEHLAFRARLLRDHAMDPGHRYWHTALGFNYRMTNLQAAVGLGQMERIEEFVPRKREIMKWYGETLAGLPGVVLPAVEPWANAVSWLYSVALDEARGWDRARLAQRLQDEGIETRPVFIPLPHLPMYREPEGSYPVAERLGRSGLSLPSGVGLKRKDVERVSARVRRSQPSAR